jgi:hypothetical protein
MILVILSFAYYITEVFAEEYSMKVWVVDGNSYRSLMLYVGDQDFQDENCYRSGSQGCYHAKERTGVESIYIVSGKVGHYPAYGGCSVLWHELLHAMGYYHDWMFKNLPNSECSYSYIHRNDWVAELYE